ncbi:MAG: DUF1178 family protein [Paracoccus sp. (in: a-proteobacteria)]|uniref:DUF1178 family protein n=1 Tax=Paracoccus sp. TaxID=267 RepID=UPI0026DEE3D4|nr:DUF1178 family protein [Paracoccus sp. (in: a-proteobacteria)]MDO5620552.1 DUF1178 family protein [Paracoccus sp. (in: a-proteobacteria)]
MIRYHLHCQNGHDFDGWFRSSEGFEQARAAGQINCTHCGSAEVEKALMAPSVDTKRQTDKPPLEKLRDYVENNSDYVGDRFVAEARAMHEGRSEQRAIHGEARPDEARQMLEDGIPVAPLPFIPRAKQN